MEAAQGDVERRRLLELHLDRAGLLIEQPGPRGVRGDRLLGEDQLLGLAQQMRAIAAQVAQVMAAEVEAVGGQQLLGAGVVERGPLQLEEQQHRLNLSLLLLNALQQGAALRIGRVGRKSQASIGARATDQVVDRSELLHGFP